MAPVGEGAVIDFAVQVPTRLGLVRNAMIA